MERNKVKNIFCNRLIDKYDFTCHIIATYWCILYHIFIYYYSKNAPNILPTYFPAGVKRSKRIC